MAEEQVATAPTAESPTAPTAPAAGQTESGASSGAAGSAQPTGIGTTAAKPSGTEQPTFDLEKSYGELRREFTKVTQENSRSRKELQATLQQIDAMRKTQEQLAAAIATATKKPVDPQRFMQDLQTQGPDALNNHLKDLIKAETAQLQQAYTEQFNRGVLQEAQIEKLHRRMDSTNYPDFAKLEPVMQEIADSENCPIDWNQPIPVIYDTLYKLARSANSESAVAAAEQFGRESAERTIGKEAAAAVPTGGRGASTAVDPKTMPLDKLREYMVSQLGESEY